MRASGQPPQTQSLPSPSPLISLWASENVNGVGRKSSATVIAGSSAIRRHASASVGPRGRRRKRSVVIGKRDERQSHDALLAREKRFRKPCRVKAKRFPSYRRRNCDNRGVSASRQLYPRKLKFACAAISVARGQLRKFFPAPKSAIQPRSLVR